MTYKKFYITTPIYYVNDIPHIGHAYTTVASDVMARYKRLKGFDVFFLTGTDEHGHKVEKTAIAMGISPKELADRVVVRFKELWKKLDISNDDFLRTTEDRHKEAVRHLWEMIDANGDIYRGTYEDWYCIPCETFLTGQQLIDGNCPDCRRPVERLKEPSYFFRMSNYQKKLLNHIEEKPEFIQPESKRNEIISFIREGLKDLSISRTSFSWGVPVPGDPNHVVYVWFDALTNYLSAAGYPKEMPKWPADIHIIGKDILRFHAVYWPTLLMAAGLPLPQQIFAHGWWTVEGEKMSKSKGNVIDPNDMVDRFGVDQFRYFLMRGVPFGQDGDFSLRRFLDHVNSDLANDLGNLLSRTLAMVEKYFDGKAPSISGSSLCKQSLQGKSRGAGLKTLLEESVQADYGRHMDELRFSLALEEIWKVIDAANRYIEESAPWVLWKEKKIEELSCVLYALSETLRIIALYIFPFMPRSSQEIWRQLGLKEDIRSKHLDHDVRWGGLKGGTKISRGKPLFPKIER